MTRVVTQRRMLSSRFYKFCLEENKITCSPLIDTINNEYLYLYYNLKILEMWLKGEIEDIQNAYREIESISFKQFITPKEEEAIADSAIYNLRNYVSVPKNVRRFMTCLRMQYLCVDK